MKLTNKYFPLLVVVAVCIGLAVGQKTFTINGANGTTLAYSSVNDNTFVPVEDYQTPSAERNVLLVVNVQEPCFYCSQIVNTASSAANSYTRPMMPVPHSYWFHTIGDALAKAEKENWEVTWLAVTRSITFEAKSVEEHVKQPDVVTTKKYYKLLEEK